MLPALLALVWLVPAITADLPTEDFETGHRAEQPVAVWSPQLAEMFPGCLEQLPKGEIPAAVIEVRSGFPVRVDFDDAWQRTHDRDDSNNGEVVGACR